MRGKLCFVWLVAACTSSGHSGYYNVGECDPAKDATPLTVTAAQVQDFNNCLRDNVGLEVVDSVAQWDALFTMCQQQVPVPAGIDLANGRAAVAHVQCSPISLRFVAESSAEIVVGVLSGVSGACIDDPLVIPLARSTKPVRMAQCSSVCDDCPPVP